MHPVEEYLNYKLDRGWVEWVQLWRPQEEGGVELLYNSVKTGSQLVWRPDQLETRCRRESQHPAAPPIESLDIRPVGEKMLEWEHVPERLGSLAPGWAAQENGKETLMAIRVGGKYVAVLFGLQLPLTHNPFNKVRGIFF